MSNLLANFKNIIQLLRYERPLLVTMN